jgi:hypothetical protein
MPPPTIKCAICRQEVSKRQTLSVEPYGRICRKHEETEKHLSKLAEMSKKDAEDRESQAKWKQASDNLNKIMFVEQIRMMATIKNMPIGLIILAFGQRIPQSIRDEVIQEAREKGPLTEEEIGNAFAMLSVLNKRY